MEWINMAQDRGDLWDVVNTAVYMSVKIVGQ